MDEQYGDESGIPNAPLAGMTILELKEEFVCLCKQWRDIKRNKQPKTCQDILHMVHTSFKEVTPLDP